MRSERYLGGLIDSRSGHLHPLKYTQGLARAAEAAGARIFENTQALSYADGAEVRIRTAQGGVRCRQLVLCGNAYLGPLAPALARRILGVGTYIIATRAARPRARARAPPEQRRHRRHQLDSRLLPPLRRPSHPVRRARELQRARAQAPGGVDAPAHGARISADCRCRRWSTRGAATWTSRGAARPISGGSRRTYFISKVSPVTACRSTGLAGKLVAEAVAGTAERFDVFARLPHRDFPGGRWLRRPSLVLAMLYYRIRDLL